MSFDYVQSTQQQSKKGRLQYVAWSGGFDSTLLLYMKCVESKENGTTAPIAMITRSNILDEQKRKREEIARQKIKEEFNKRELHFYETYVDINLETYFEKVNRNQYGQAGYWLLSFMPFIPDGSDLSFGYISNDGFSYYKDSFMQIFDGLCRMLSVTDISVKFPLLDYSKNDVLRFLNQYNLQDLPWGCECPTDDGQECGECIPCKTHISSLVQNNVTKHNYSTIKEALTNTNVVEQQTSEVVQMNKAVFLDRDGVISDSSKFVNEAEDLILYPWSAEAIKLLNDNGFKVFVVTNQGGITLGYLTEEELERIHNKMNTCVESHGGKIDKVEFCPHYAVKCSCRKPMPGMILKLAKEYEINLSESWMIGDQKSDVDAGMSAGCRTIRIGTTSDDVAEYTTSNLLHAVHYILKYAKR